MPVRKNKYVIVNIWTSMYNPSLPGANVGHVSLSVCDGDSETYMSLWPGGHRTYTPGLFKSIDQIVSNLFPDFIERPASYKQNYERDCILEAMSEKKFREVADIKECLEDETPYRYHSSTGEYIRLTEQPRAIKPEEHLIAIKLIPANFRVILFSLNVNDILDEFERLKQPDHVTGWSMAGSNLFTRNLSFTGKTSENCASIVYRCLNAGGLYSNLGSQHSAPLSSAVSPDDLLRLIVAVKVIEKRQYWGDPDSWTVPGLEETPIDSVISAYKEEGQEANATHDIIPRVKPSLGCSVM